MSNFSRILEAFRSERQISKKDLAHKAKLTPGYISLLTLGEREAPSQATVVALADALELDEKGRRELFEAAGHTFAPASLRLLDEPVLDREIGLYRKGGKINDGGEAPLDNPFYGRTQSFAKLEHWIVEDNCHLVAVVGMAGVGKSTLSANLAKRIEDDFDFVFWRSLQSLPPLKTILQGCILHFSNQRKTDLPANEYDQISQLVDYLRTRRCLLILDNFESILQPSDSTGRYRQGYDGYGLLLERLAETHHQSCLLVNSREKPREVARLEGASSLIRSLELQGVGVQEAQEILQREAVYAQDNEVWTRFITFYAGNPLALKIVAASIRELFGGDIALFLREGEPIFGDIYALFDWQFARLSNAERDIMYWLAINGGTVTVSELRDDLVPVMSMKVLQENVYSLRRRSIISMHEGGRFGVDQAIKQYSIDQLVQAVCQELDSKQTRLLQSHALMKAQAKEYVREGQIHLFVEPVVEHLFANYGREKSAQLLFEILDVYRRDHVERLRHILPGNYLAGNILNLLVHMKWDLRGADFSQFAIWQAYLQGVILQKVNLTNADLNKTIFTDSFSSIYCIAVSPNGEYLAAGTMNGEVRTWETSSGQPIDTFTWHADRVRAVAFSPDGNYLVSASEDQTICIQDRNTGAPEYISDTIGNIGRVYSIAFSPDSQQLVSGGQDEVVRIWDVQTRTLIQTFSGHQSRIWSVAYSQDAMIASAGEDQTIRIWDSRSGECVRVLNGHQAPIRSVAFSLNGHLLASGSEDQTIRVWNTINWQCIQVFKSDRDSGKFNWIRSVTFDYDGKIVISGGDDRTVRLWDIATGTCHTTLHGHTNWVRSVAISRDGTVLASGGEDQTICIWELASDKCRKILQGHSTHAYSITFSPDGKLLAGSGENQSIYLWNIMAEEASRTTLAGHQNLIRSFAFSPDGRYLASGSEDNTARIWEVSTGLLKHTFAHDDWVYSVAFSVDGRFLATGSEDKLVHIWDVNSGQDMWTFNKHTDWVTGVCFSPRGHLLASGGDDPTVQIWDFARRNLQEVLQSPKGRIFFINFSADGRFLLAGGGSSYTHIWQTSDYSLRTLHDPVAPIHYATFHPNSRIIASANEEYDVRIWEVTSGKYIYEFRDEKKISCLAYSPDGSMLATSNEDGTIKLYDAQTYTLLKEMRGERPYEHMNITRARNLTLAQRKKLKDLGATEE